MMLPKAAKSLVCYQDPKDNITKRRSCDVLNISFSFMFETNYRYFYRCLVLRLNLYILRGFIQYN